MVYGLFVGVDIKKEQWNNLNAVEEANRNNEITCMCWSTKDQDQVWLFIPSLVSGLGYKIGPVCLCVCVHMSLNAKSFDV